MPNDEKPPSRAAPRAGTISSVIVIGSIEPLTVATRTPRAGGDQGRRAPSSTPGQHVGREAQHDGAVLVLGRRPGRQAEPGEAVDGPQDDGDEHDDDGGQHDLVLRDGDPAGQLERAPWPGSAARGGAPAPKRRTTIACSTISRPTDATTLASGGARSSGRNTSRWSSSPSTTITASVIGEGRGDRHAAPRGSRSGRATRGRRPGRAEGQRVGQRRQEQLARPAAARRTRRPRTMAMAPAEKSTTPEPRWVRTTAKAMAADQRHPVAEARARASFGASAADQRPRSRCWSRWPGR